MTLETLVAHYLASRSQYQQLCLDLAEWRKETKSIEEDKTRHRDLAYHLAGIIKIRYGDAANHLPDIDATDPEIPF